MPDGYAIMNSLFYSLIERWPNKTRVR